MRGGEAKKFDPIPESWLRCRPAGVGGGPGAEKRPVQGGLDRAVSSVMTITPPSIAITLSDHRFARGPNFYALGKMFYAVFGTLSSGAGAVSSR